LNAVEAAFQPVLGLPCWGVQCGYGSFLTLEFGQPHLEVVEPRPIPDGASEKTRRQLGRRLVTVHGDWHLWLYCCHWFVYANGARAGDSSTKKSVQEAVRVLAGQKLVAIKVNQLPGRSAFEFDLGARLVTRPYDDEARHGWLRDQWLLYEPSKMVLTFRSDGKYSHQSENTLPADVEWHSFKAVVEDQSLGGG